MRLFKDNRFTVNFNKLVETSSELYEDKIFQDSINSIFELLRRYSFNFKLEDFISILGDLYTIQLLRFIKKGGNIEDLDIEDWTQPKNSPVFGLPYYLDSFYKMIRMNYNPDKKFRDRSSLSGIRAIMDYIHDILEAVNSKFNVLYSPNCCINLREKYHVSSSSNG